MASRSRHLLFLTPPSLICTPQPQSRQQPPQRPHPSHLPHSLSKSQSPTTFFTPSSKQKLEFHTNQNIPLQKVIFSTRKEELGKYIVVGMVFLLFWGICVGIDKSKAEGKKSGQENDWGREVCKEEDDGNEYWFFGMFVRRKGRAWS
jgi:preprotein translocase subunit SecE